MKSTNNKKPQTLKGQVKTYYYPIRRSQLAHIYAVDKDIIKLWLQEIDIHSSSTLSPNEILKFVKHYGWPRPDIHLSIPGLTISNKPGDNR